MSEPKLTIELVPRACWSQNVRTELSAVEWDVIRGAVYQFAEYSCDVCDKATTKLHAHEVWDYSIRTKTQKLIGLQALCERCHEVKHFGRASVTGRGKQARAHLRKINGWTEHEAQTYILEQFGEWELRNEVKHWKLDITYLKEFMENA